MFKWPWLLITMASRASPGRHEIMDSFLCENAHWLFVLMKSPSRSFEIQHLWTACATTYPFVSNCYSIFPAIHCVLWLWHLLSSFHRQLQLFQPASKSVNLCILFREQSKDSQSRLPCQHSSQSAQPTLEFFRNLLVWSPKLSPRHFSRALSKLQVIARNCDWFIALPAPVVIGRSNCFGFGFSTVIWRPLFISALLFPLQWFANWPLPPMAEITDSSIYM